MELEHSLRGHDFSEIAYTCCVLASGCYLYLSLQCFYDLTPCHLEGTEFGRVDLLTIASWLCSFLRNESLGGCFAAGQFECSGMFRSLKIS